MSFFNKNNSKLENMIQSIIDNMATKKDLKELDKKIYRLERAMEINRNGNRSNYSFIETISNDNFFGSSEEINSAYQEYY